jgi:lipopolysaccharide/colanic/teichoic acid biosynthesis glycosyltransferase
MTAFSIKAEPTGAYVPPADGERPRSGIDRSIVAQAIAELDAARAVGATAPGKRRRAGVPVDALGWQFALKHALDRAVALLALVVLAPVLLLIALAVRSSSPGCVIFRQRRVGRHGREFDIYKFRTMVAGTDADRFTPPDGLAPGGVEGVDRRTRIGRWLRSTSLDELPQLVNVLSGEMSLVGPRPERPEFVERFAREVPHYRDRHRVKPGITGWAQANGLRGQTSIAERVQWDNHYIRNWSPGLELRTLALTVLEILHFRARADSRHPTATRPSWAVSASPTPGVTERHPDRSPKGREFSVRLGAEAVTADTAARPGR